jgi:hypothetical protein
MTAYLQNKQRRVVFPDALDADELAVKDLID